MILIQTLSVSDTYIRSGVFTPDGEQIITGGWDGIARLWNVKTGQIIRTFEERIQPAIHKVFLTTDGNNLLLFVQIGQRFGI